MYQLKNGQEGFEVVDGPDAGKAYRRGRSYPNAPAGYENRFEKVTGKADKKTTKPDIPEEEKMPANGGHAGKRGGK